MRIKFKANSKFWEDSVPAPSPAKNHMPKWYKKQGHLMEGEKEYALYKRTPNTTVKACSPFSDAFSTGYIWTAPLDIQIQKINNGDSSDFVFDWRIDEEFVSFHSLEQMGSIPAAYDGEQGVCKWTFEYSIETPPGYSMMFTHPLNRHELPFRTFSGIVDSDSYSLPVQFPFQLLNLKNEFTIIEKGTPLVQMIPIKRERWDTVSEAYNKEKVEKERFEYFSKIYRAYKTRHWHRKEYY
jgi:hypothetical protein